MAERIVACETISTRDVERYRCYRHLKSVPGEEVLLNNNVSNSIDIAIQQCTVPDDTTIPLVLNKCKGEIGEKGEKGETEEEQ